MRRAGGYLPAGWACAPRQGRGFGDSQTRLYELSLGEGRHVSAKVREFVAIALLCFRAGERAGLVAHMRRAIQFGATPAELVEVLEACLGPAGARPFPRGLAPPLEARGPPPP